MALVIREAFFDEGNKNDKKLIIGGNSRILYLKGEGFISSKFPLEVIVPKNDGNDDGLEVKAQEIGEDISEGRLSVVVTANRTGGDVEKSIRDVVLKKKGANWSKEDCIQDGKNKNSECALIEDAIELVK